MRYENIHYLIRLSGTLRRLNIINMYVSSQTMRVGIVNEFGAVVHSYDLPVIWEEEYGTEYGT